jgi:hypothetical protein
MLGACCAGALALKLSDASAIDANTESLIVLCIAVLPSISNQLRLVSAERNN